jgi:hypothetical protein
MRVYRLAVGITVGLMLTVATVWAADGPKAKTIRSEFACSSVPSTFDNNGDGITATTHQCIGKGTGGPFTSQGVSELLAPLPAPVTCPQGTIEYPYEAIFDVATNSNTFDQLIAGDVQPPGAFCLNPNGLTFTFDVTYFFFRGTGKLDGAQGGSTIHSQGTGSIVACDPAGLCVSNYSGTSETTLVFP